MSILNYEELNQACLDTLKLAPGYNYESLVGLQVLYATGCRPQELVESSLWVEYDMNHLELTTLKLSGTRIILKSSLPPDFVTSVVEGRNFFQSVRIAQIYGLFAKYWPYPEARVKDKSTKLYVYRYRFVKFLSSEGYTNEAIGELMGWTTAYLVPTYLNADIIV